MKANGKRIWNKIKKAGRAIQRSSPLGKKAVQLAKKAVKFAKKRKKQLICAAVILLFALILLFLAVLVSWKMAFVLIFIAVVLAVAALLVNYLCKHWTGWEKPTSYFSDLKHRNVEGLVLGSTKAWKYVDFSATFGAEKELYNCTAYRRSLKMDFATLKTYHSHVRKGGKVFLIFDYAEAEKLGNQIFPRDFQYVHPHYFLYTGEKENKRKSKWPILFYPEFATGFVCCKLLKYAGYYRRSTWKVYTGRNMNINTEKVYKTAGILDQMLSFCWERGLEPVLILLGGNPDNHIANDILKAYFAPKYYFYDIATVDTASELNQLINEDIAI